MFTKQRKLGYHCMNSEWFDVMDDNTKKILLSAAKAAGITHDGVGFVTTSSLPINWNPYESDADLLGLARKLRMAIDYKGNYVWCSTEDGTVYRKFWGQGGEHENDARAIVAVAAAIGDAMP